MSARTSATGDRIEWVVNSNDDPLAGDGPNVILNLMKAPKRISPVYVYDKRGTALFERQCDTPEYYLRRAELRLLQDHAAEIAAYCGWLPIVELGAGTAEKTRIILAHYQGCGMHCDYYPIDVDTDTLLATARRLTSSYSTLFVHCVGTTYEAGLRALPPLQNKLVLFLGSSLGNMELTEIDHLLGLLYGHSIPGDYVLLGVDLDKDPAIINRAYNDLAGFGARSTLNMLRHLNRRYRANFALHRFRYRSHYDARARRNDVRIESLVRQSVTFNRLDFTASLSAGELVDAEVMWKFDPDDLETRLRKAGFSTLNRWIEPVFQYGLFLLRR